MGCPYTGRCPLYAEFTLEASLRTWQIRYCESDFQSCVRHRMAVAGQQPDPRLLPNGARLPSKAKD